METATELVSTFIVNALWQISALLIIAVVCARLIRRTAAGHQYLFWVAVFILSVGLPVLSLYNFRDNSKFILRLPLENNHANIYQSNNTPKATEDELLIQSREQSGSFGMPIVLLAVSICYFSFLFYRFIHLLDTWRRTARLRHLVKNEKLSPQINAVAERCCAAFQIEFVPIFFSAQAAAPLTLGAKKPIIILPESFLKITSEKTLTAVLGHELAHIRRRDYGLNLICEFLSLLVSFHPAVRIMKRKINQTREMACDELVSEHLLKPLDYARSLVQIADFITPSSQTAYTLGVFNADILEKRIMKLIETSRGANQRLGKIRCLFVITLLGITAMVTSVFSLALPLGQKQESQKNTILKDETLEPVSVKLASGLPVSIKFATVTKFEDNSVLTYSIANNDSQKLDTVGIWLFVFDANGKPKGGEGWSQRVDLANNASIDFSKVMKTKVTLGDRVVFSIFKAKGQAGQWEADSTKVIEAIKAFITGNRYALPEAHFTVTK